MQRPLKIDDVVRAYRHYETNVQVNDVQGYLDTGRPCTKTVKSTNQTYMGLGTVVLITDTEVTLAVTSWGGDQTASTHTLKVSEYTFELEEEEELPPEVSLNRYSIELDEVRYQIRIMETTPNGVQEAACYEQGDWRQSPNIVFQLVRDIISVLTKDEMPNFAHWKENDNLSNFLPKSLADGSLEMPKRTELKPCDNFEQLLTQVGRMMDLKLGEKRDTNPDGRQLLHDQVVWGCYVTDFLKILHKMMGTPNYGVVQRMGKLALAQPEENIILTPVEKPDKLVGIGKRPE